MAADKWYNPVGSAAGRWIRRRGAVALCAFAPVAVAMAATGSSARWRPPLNVSVIGSFAIVPQLGVDAGGDAVAIWNEARKGGAGAAPYVVMACQRPAGKQAWDRPLALTPTGGQANDPRLAVDSRGDAVAAWRSDSTVQVTFKTAAGAWQTPADVSNTGQRAGEPSVAIDAQGDAAAVWTQSASTGQHAVWAAIRTAHSAHWQPSREVYASPQIVSVPEVALDHHGDIAIVWKVFESGSPARGLIWRVQATSEPAGASRRAVRAIGTEADGPPPYLLGLGPGPQVILDRHANAIVVWQAPRRLGGSEIRSAMKSAGSVTWQPSTRVSNFGTAGSLPRLAEDDAGDAIMVWQGSDGEHAVISSALHHVSGRRWTRPVNVSAGGADNIGPSVAFDSRGNAIAIWGRFDPSRFDIQAAFRSVTGRWRAPSTVGSGVYDAGAPTVGLDRAGHGIGMWVHQDAGNALIIQSSDYQAA